MDLNWGGIPKISNIFRSENSTFKTLIKENFKLHFPHNKFSHKVDKFLQRFWKTIER